MQKNAHLVDLLKIGVDTAENKLDAEVEGTGLLVLLILSPGLLAELAGQSPWIGAANRRPLRPKLKGSVGEGPNQTNYSDRSSVRILGIGQNSFKIQEFALGN